MIVDYLPQIKKICRFKLNMYVFFNQISPIYSLLFNYFMTCLTLFLILSSFQYIFNKNIQNQVIYYRKFRNIGPGLISREKTFLVSVYSGGGGGGGGLKAGWIFCLNQNKAIFLSSKHLIFKTWKLIKSNLIKYLLVFLPNWMTR